MGQPTPVGVPRQDEGKVTTSTGLPKVAPPLVDLAMAIPPRWKESAKRLQATYTVAEELPALLGSTTITDPWLMELPAILTGRLKVLPQSLEREKRICVLLEGTSSSSWSSSPLVVPVLKAV